jgi:CRISPR/Cas system-associated exonuclease Cas4 (RecB family)
VFGLSRVSMYKFNYFYCKSGRDKISMEMVKGEDGVERGPY